MAKHRVNKFRKIKPRHQRLYFTLFSLVCLGLAAYFIAAQLKDNFMYFVTPSEIDGKNIPVGKAFRLGGLVKMGSFKEVESGKYVFIVTDTHTDQEAVYKGMLPSLFREGQGVIATGKLSNNGIFMASEILAKHDENYMPKEVYEKIKKHELERK